MMKQPKVGMKTVAMLAICTDGYAINHRTVVGVTREAMSKLWDLIAVSYTHLTLPTNREV